MTDARPHEIAECDSARLVRWQRYFAPTPDRNMCDVLVCHGNVIRWTRIRALGADTRGWANMDCGNASLTIIAVRPDGIVRPAMFGVVGADPGEEADVERAGAGGAGRR